MTERDLVTRLRERIDKLADALEARDFEVDRLEELIAAGRESAAARGFRARRCPRGRCPYCGTATKGRACGAHRDLLRLDPTVTA